MRTPTPYDSIWKPDVRMVFESGLNITMSVATAVRAIAAVASQPRRATAKAERGRS